MSMWSLGTLDLTDCRLHEQADGIQVAAPCPPTGPWQPAWAVTTFQGTSSKEARPPIGPSRPQQSLIGPLAAPHRDEWSLTVRIGQGRLPLPRLEIAVGQFPLL